MANKTLAPPAYREHKARGLAKVRIRGKDYYLGKYGTRESKRKYKEVLAKHWMPEVPEPELLKAISVDEVCLRFLKHAEQFYQKTYLEGKKPTSQAAITKRALKLFRQYHSGQWAKDFGPRKFRLFRQKLIEQRLSRSTINAYMFVVRKAFELASSDELIPAHIHGGLMTVKPLAQDRSDAKETNDIQCVSNEIIEATKAELPQGLQDMIDIQLFTGMRPSELLIMRKCDIELGDVWVYIPAVHKNSHRRTSKTRHRSIALGDKCQAILSNYLHRADGAFLFSPLEISGRGGKRYNKDSYRRAITRACERAKVDKWSPNQLRHNRATELCEKYGLEVAANILDHGNTKTTARYYVERTDTVKLKVAADS